MKRMQTHKTSVLRPDVFRGVGSVIAFIICVVVLIGALWWASGKYEASKLPINKDAYQAVFLEGGQTYFGKLSVVNQQYLQLSDVYYLQDQQDQADEAIQNASRTQENVQLIKLGGEIHGPEDEMIIAQSKVMYYENLKEDGKVVRSIKAHRSSQN